MAAVNTRTGRPDDPILERVEKTDADAIDRMGDVKHALYSVIVEGKEPDAEWLDGLEELADGRLRVLHWAWWLARGSMIHVPAQLARRFRLFLLHEQEIQGEELSKHALCLDNEKRHPAIVARGTISNLADLLDQIGWVEVEQESAVDVAVCPSFLDHLTERMQSYAQPSETDADREWTAWCAELFPASKAGGLC